MDETRDNSVKAPTLTAAPLDYVVTFVVLEGRQLAGLEIDPYVQMNIGAETKRTKAAKETNEPVYNEVVII
jgi:hypothetical protein